MLTENLRVENRSNSSGQPNSLALPTRRGDQIPLFTTLTRAECESLLARNSVGRIAFAVHDRVSILPIHYVFSGGWIYGRTTSATKLRQILRNRRIAFEVDEHSKLFEWQSVVVHGPLYVVQADSTQHTRSVYRTALSLIQRLIPDALTTNDPVPFRDQLFRIRAIDVSGRASAPSGGQRQFPDAVRAITETAQPDHDQELHEEVRVAIDKLDVPETADVHVDVFDGVVVLSGTVETGRDRQAIEAQVLAIPAVTAVVQEIETDFPARQEVLPSELARAAVGQLGVLPATVPNRLKVVVEHGWLRLEGEVSSQRERDNAIRGMRAVAGARGVIDRTHIVAREK